MERIIGRVIGNTDIRGFLFHVNPNENVRIYEYVKVIEDGEEIIAVVTSIQYKPISSVEPIPWQVMTKVDFDESMMIAIAEAKIINKEVKRPPKVGSWVYLASDDDVERVYSVPSYRGLEIGNLLTRENVRIRLDANYLSRHLAIIAATGSGKTWTSVVLIEELLKKGATVLILDPHGEYVELKDSAQGSEFEGRISVIKGHRSQRGDLLYKIGLKDMSAEELASIMNIPPNANRIRTLLRGLKMLADQREEYDLRYMKDMLETVLSKFTKTSFNAFMSVMKKYVGEGEEIEKGLKNVWLALSRNLDPAYDLLRYIEELESLGVYSSKTMPLGSVLKPASATIVNLSGLKQEVQDHIAYNILKRVFEARVRYVRGLKGEKYPYPIVVIVEEAHRFAPPKSEGQTWSVEMLKRIATEGRKFGVFLVVISQRPSRVDQTVLSQCQTQIIMKIVNPLDQEAVLKASEQLGHDLVRSLPSLAPGEALIVGPMVRQMVFVKVRRRKLEYSGQDLNVVEEWSRSFDALEKLNHIKSLLKSAFGEDYVEELMKMFDASREEVEGAFNLILTSKIYLGGDENGLRAFVDDCEVVYDGEWKGCNKQAIIASYLEALRRGILLVR